MLDIPTEIKCTTSDDLEATISKLLLLGFAPADSHPTKHYHGGVFSCAGDLIHRIMAEGELGEYIIVTNLTELEEVTISTGDNRLDVDLNFHMEVGGSFVFITDAVYARMVAIENTPHYEDHTLTPIEGYELLAKVKELEALIKSGGDVAGFMDEHGLGECEQNND